jgi:hypothetical protein
MGYNEKTGKPCSKNVAKISCLIKKDKPLDGRNGLYYGYCPEHREKLFMTNKFKKEHSTWYVYLSDCANKIADIKKLTYEQRGSGTHLELAAKLEISSNEEDNHFATSWYEQYRTAKKKKRNEGDRELLKATNDFERMKSQLRYRNATSMRGLETLNFNYDESDDSSDSDAGSKSKNSSESEELEKDPEESSEPEEPNEPEELPKSKKTERINFGFDADEFFRINKRQKK